MPKVMQTVLRLQTFGGLSLQGDHGPLGGAAAQPRRLTLLAILAEAGERGVTRDKLIGLLWPEASEPRARSALSQALYALKRDAGRENLVAGYDRLTLADDALTSDIADFRCAIATGDLARAASLYAGPFLDGVHVGGAPELEHWLDAARLRLSRAAEDALEQLAERSRAGGDHAAAVEWWGRLTVLDPLKASAIVGLMQSLASSGDRAGALRHAERHERRMREELDSGASDDVVRLARTLRGAPALPDGALPGPGASQRPSRIPLIGDPMIGRDAELAEARALLCQPGVRLLTLTGAGGVGKTRLALQLAREGDAHFDSVHFADLSPVREVAGVAPAMASAAGLTIQSNRDPLEAIATAAAGRRVLLVLDNFEQVIDAAPLVAHLLSATSGLTVVATSRMRLALPVEHEIPINPLAVPDRDVAVAALRENPAVRLFVRRATGARSSLVFDDDALRAAAHICNRLDGLPLAIELAAARCRLLSPAAVAERLDAGFELLSGGSRTRPKRHQTIRRTIGWSYDLLDACEQRLFVRMSVFAGGCTLAAVESICADTGAALVVLDGLTALVDASAIVADDRSGCEPRFRMLETVHEFAGDLLADDPATNEIACRHTHWYARLAESLAPQLTGESQGAALATLVAEHANLSAALERVLAGGDVHTALRLGASLWRYWLMRGHLVAGRAWLARILALDASPDDSLASLRADVMTGAGHLAQNSGAVNEATDHFRAALAIRQRLGDREGVARALADLGWMRWRQCDFPDARRLSSECLALADALGATRVAALALTNLGATALFEGKFDEACTVLARSVELRERVADRRGVAFANTLLGWALCRAGDFDRATELLDSAAETLHLLDDGRLAYLARDVAAEVALRQGDAARAARILALESISIGRRFGDRWSAAHGLALASWTARLLGRLDQATHFGEESLTLRRAEDDRYGEAESLALLAAVARASGDDSRASTLLRESRAIRAAIGDAAGLAECDDALATVGLRA